MTPEELITSAMAMGRLDSNRVIVSFYTHMSVKLPLSLLIEQPLVRRNLISQKRVSVYDTTWGKLTACRFPVLGIFKDSDSYSVLSLNKLRLGIPSAPPALAPQALTPPPNMSGSTPPVSFFHEVMLFTDSDCWPIHLSNAQYQGLL